MSQGDAQRWLRPATDREEYFEIAHQNCLCLTFYSLALSASKPLKEDVVRQALVHLYRHVLRCLIRAFCILLDVLHLVLLALLTNFCLFFSFLRLSFFHGFPILSPPAACSDAFSYFTSLAWAYGCGAGRYRCCECAWASGTVGCGCGRWTAAGWTSR